MIIFSTGASTMTYIINDMLNIQYGFLVALSSLLGSCIGMILLDIVLRKMNRQSPLVFMLVFMFFSSLIAVPYFGS
jgi:uncharacterized membrane protein YfcA